MNLDKLKGKVSQKVIDELPLVFNRFKIDTPVRLAHFLGQCSHESANFTATSENLNYSAEGLLKIFPKYFPNMPIASQYARKPQSIANSVYSNRMGNKNEASGDGWKFRGRGYIQLTGFSNYNEFDSFVDDNIIANPDLVSTKYPLLSAAWFWNKNKITAISDKGVSDETIKLITRRVNGGEIGLAHRIQETKKFFDLLK